MIFVEPTNSKTHPVTVDKYTALMLSRIEESLTSVKQVHTEVPNPSDPLAAMLID